MNSRNLLDLPKRLRDPQTASIEMLRRSFILPEEQKAGLLQRVYDEELSLVTEALKGYINIVFDFDLSCGKLVAANGESITNINANGIEFYKQKTAQDSRYEFMVKRAIYEYQESLEAEKLAKNMDDTGTIVTISPYPEEAERLYGQSFVQSLGFHTETKRAMLRATQKTENGIRLYTRAVDGSDLSKWNQILPNHYHADTTDDMLANRLYFSGNAVNVLDDLQLQYELISEQRIDNQKNDIWQFVQQKRNLIDYFNNQLFELSKTNLYGEELKNELNRLRRDFWSAIKLSHESYIKGEQYMANSSVSDIFSVSGAVTEARRENFISCGMEILPINQLSTKEMLQEIFGQKDILKCVKCPFCNKTVDAKVGKSTIECLNKSCGAKLDTNSGKRIDKNSNKKSFIDLIIDLFFEKDNQKKPKKLL